MEHSRNNGQQNSPIAYYCTVCGTVLPGHPLTYTCPDNHPCCEECYQNFMLDIRDDYAQMCPVCRGSTQQARSLASIPSTASSINLIDPPTLEDELFERYIGMSKQVFSDNKLRSKLTLPTFVSKRPFRCPHNQCRNYVALSHYAAHYHSEHLDVKTYTTEKGKELLMHFDVASMEVNQQRCLGMINVYETNNLPNLSPKTSNTVLKKFSQKVPLGTFWLMTAVEVDKYKNPRYGLFWLFSNTGERYYCTIELSCMDDAVSVATLCGVSNGEDNECDEGDGGLGRIMEKMRCLIVDRETARYVASNVGSVCNLRVCVR